MSNTQEIINRIFDTEGVTALVVYGVNGSLETVERGDPGRVRDLHEAIEFESRTTVHSMLALGGRKIIVRRHGTVRFAVEHPVGHGVAKSIDRMLRRSAKRLLAREAAVA